MKYPVIYLYLLDDISKRADRGGVIKKSEAKSCLNKHHNIPKQISVATLVDMVNHGLLISISRREFKIKRVKEVKMISSCGLLYNELGLF